MELSFCFFLFFLTKNLKQHLSITNTFLFLFFFLVFNSIKMQELKQKFCLLAEKLTRVFYFSGLRFSLSSGSNFVTSSLSSSEAYEDGMGENWTRIK